MSEVINTFHASGHVQFYFEKSSPVVWDGPKEHPIETRPALKLCLLEEDAPKRPIELNIAKCDWYAIAGSLLSELLLAEADTIGLSETKMQLLKALREDSGVNWSYDEIDNCKVVEHNSGVEVIEDTSSAYGRDAAGHPNIADKVSEITETYNTEELTALNAAGINVLSTKPDDASSDAGSFVEHGLPLRASDVSAEWEKQTEVDVPNGDVVRRSATFSCNTTTNASDVINNNEIACVVEQTLTWDSVRQEVQRQLDQLVREGKIKLGFDKYSVKDDFKFDLTRALLTAAVDWVNADLSLSEALTGSKEEKVARSERVEALQRFRLLLTEVDAIIELNAKIRSKSY